MFKMKTREIRETAALPLEGPLLGRRVLEIVRETITYMDPDDNVRQVEVVTGLEPLDEATIYEVKAGFSSRKRYFQSVEGKLIRGFAREDLLIF